MRATISRKVGIPRSRDSCCREICASSWASFSSAWARPLCKPFELAEPTFAFGFQDAHEEVVADLDEPRTFRRVNDEDGTADTDLTELILKQPLSIERACPETEGDHEESVDVRVFGVSWAV
ncbi:hypothetical protein SNA_20940 [Streptomyces natalensis ATCC 27448]|uniref:Uncharacterized protein n=1 Tax=Streptomyces natalensis ATCC 27448 TaxID=1240678 RepID=A0A0D7CK42_9ACTN|nr:hypothetical protein SNA_20940 [Streptomyces natalensis ATCC 27448]